MSKKVAVIMGSDSDLDTMRPCIQRLKSFGIPTEVHIISAHRTPAAAERFAQQEMRYVFTDEMPEAVLHRLFQLLCQLVLRGAVAGECEIDTLL